MKFTTYKFIFKSSTLLAASILLASCSYFKDSEKKEKPVIVATYKGGEVTKTQINYELKKLAVQNPKIASITFEDLPTNQKELLVKEIVLKKAAVKKAKKYDLDEDEVYVQAHDIFESTMLQKQLYLKLSKEATTDDKLRAKYDELVEQIVGKQDFKLGLLVVATKNEADDLSVKLKRKPSNFVYYVKTKSIDESSKKNQGVLDYSIESSFPENIIKIVKNLKKNETSEPFAIGDKWAIIQFIDKRNTEIKSFEDSKPALIQVLTSEAIKNFNDMALKKAEIKLTVE